MNYLNYKDFKTQDKRKNYRKLKDKRFQESRFYFDEFDVEDMNYRLRKLPRIFKERYEQDLRPTMRQIKVIKRKYVVYRKSKKSNPKII